MLLHLLRLVLEPSTPPRLDFSFHFRVLLVGLTQLGVNFIAWLRLARPLLQLEYQHFELWLSITVQIYRVITV